MLRSYLNDFLKPYIFLQVDYVMSVQGLQMEDFVSLLQFTAMFVIAHGPCYIN